MASFGCGVCVFAIAGRTERPASPIAMTCWSGMRSTRCVWCSGRTGGSEPAVCLRSSLRPPLAMRPGYRLPIPEPAAQPYLWELPAGLIEPGEVGESGPARVRVAGDARGDGAERRTRTSLWSLGHAVLSQPRGGGREDPSLFHARVDPSRGRRASRPTAIRSRPGPRWCSSRSRSPSRAAEAGRVRDVKTELGLRRFREVR